VSNNELSRIRGFNKRIGSSSGESAAKARRHCRGIAIVLRSVTRIRLVKIENPSECVSLSLSLFPVAPTLEHRALVKLFVSLQFLNPETVGRTPWTGDQPVVRPLPKQTHNKR
jgi:hypothetical protein